ncbi:MAG: threonine--tRNA ligase [Elusimicrobia bacterium GWA2_56_46]|nr:MAG: threonine--tRNA ligase [Elusimicrobia bacterium GWA2_56_46]OGR53711.1 MAG: threonine--tRNA ligase [Elusimicrobia bacterium GWC2_56_31]
MSEENKNGSVETMRHSLAHVMAQAVAELFPGVKFGIGPAIENGFYYDFDLEHHFTPEDLPIIEKKMKHILGQAQKFERVELSRADALEHFGAKGEKYKVELINDLPEGSVISVYRNGPFEDLCKGPHVDHTGKLKAFRLTSIAGAYWRGSEKNPMLQRIYGVAFETREELDAYLKQQEEAAKRDHRKLGRQLDLYSINDIVGPGLVLWHPNGARIRHAIETYWKEEHFKGGYDLINTPHLGRENLWATSGHLDFYKESMYAPMDIDGINYYAKPMNCPFHIQIYQSSARSYRDLPLRWAELGTVYRFEKAGVLHGLMRVRGFTQDDAHIICTPEQIEAETIEVLRFSLNIWKTFGFSEIKAYLATRPEGAVGDPARWEEAQKSLLSAVNKEGVKVEIDEGGGAFYGPKIDLKVKDTLGREWQTTTIQFDFNLPERFKMEYTGSDGQKHQPYMVHRALLGSLERFFGILIEHYGGNFPLWLAPTQVKVLNITQEEESYAREIVARVRAAGLRAGSDLRNDTINAKVREAAMEKIPYLVVVGKKEKDAGTVTLRLRGNKSVFGVSLDEVITNLVKEAGERRLTGSY